MTDNSNGVQREASPVPPAPLSDERRNLVLQGFIGFIGSGENSRGRFPKTLTELADDVRDYVNIGTASSPPSPTPEPSPVQTEVEPEPDESWFACLTGDCPHDTQAECDAQIRVDLVAEARRAHSAVLEMQEWRGLAQRAAVQLGQAIALELDLRHDLAVALREANERATKQYRDSIDFADALVEEKTRELREDLTDARASAAKYVEALNNADAAYRAALSSFDERRPRGPRRTRADAAYRAALSSFDALTAAVDLLPTQIGGDTVSRQGVRRLLSHHSPRPSPDTPDQ